MPSRSCSCQGSIPQIELQTGQLTVVGKDMVLNNMDQFVLNDLSIDLEKNVIVVDVTFDKVVGECDYSMKGKLLFLQLNGQGKAEFTFTPFVKQCKRDANLNGCLIENIDILKKDHFTKPIPKLFLPQFSPFHIPRVDIQTATLNITCVDLYLSHMDTVVVNDLKMDLENVELFVDVLFEKLDGRCDYQMKGKLLVLELNGGGKGEFNLTKVHGIIKLKGDKITKGDEHFLSYKENELTLDMQGDSTVKLENIINNNKELSEATNKVVNENIKEFINEILPSIADTAEQIFLSIMNKLTQTYSIEQLFVQ